MLNVMVVINEIEAILLVLIHGKKWWISSWLLELIHVFRECKLLRTVLKVFNVYALLQKMEVVSSSSVLVIIEHDLLNFTPKQVF